MNSWLTACDGGRTGNSIISVGSLCVNVHDHFQLQPGIIDANRPVFKSVQCKVILKQNAPPAHTHSHSFRGFLIPEGCGPWILMLGQTGWCLMCPQVDRATAGPAGPRDPWRKVDCATLGTGWQAAWGAWRDQHRLTAGMWESVCQPVPGLGHEGLC